MKTSWAVTVAGVLATSGTASAATVHLDMSSVMGYDAVATQAEMDHLASIPGASLPEAGKRTLLHTIGGHSLLNNGGHNSRAYYAGDGGLPVNGLTGAIGDRDYRFEAFDNGDGDAATPNAFLLSARGTTPSITWTLAPSQQQQYDDINFLFVAFRSNTAGSYQARITANYTDGTSIDIYDTGLVAVAANGVGGSFGSAGVGNEGGFYQADDETSSDVTKALGMTTSIDHTGSWNTNPTSRVNTSTTASIWRFTNPLDLDATRTLESITFYASSQGSARNGAYFLAASATTAVPEPASAALLLSMVVGMGMVRRRVCL